MQLQTNVQLTNIRTVSKIIQNGFLVPAKPSMTRAGRDLTGSPATTASTSSTSGQAPKEDIPLVRG